MDVSEPGKVHADRIREFARIGTSWPVVWEIEDTRGILSTNSLDEARKMAEKQTQARDKPCQENKKSGRR